MLRDCQADSSGWTPRDMSENTGRPGNIRDTDRKAFAAGGR
jgi:hypothetical protein